MVFLRISLYSQENNCVGVSSFIKLLASSLQLYYKETPTQMFSCEFCEIFKNTFFQRTPLVAASASGLWFSVLT